MFLGFPGVRLHVFVSHTGECSITEGRALSAPLQDQGPGHWDARSGCRQAGRRPRPVPPPRTAHRTEPNRTRQRPPKGLRKYKEQVDRGAGPELGQKPAPWDFLRLFPPSASAVEPGRAWGGAGALTSPTPTSGSGDRGSPLGGGLPGHVCPARPRASGNRTSGAPSAAGRAGDPAATPGRTPGHLPAPHGPARDPSSLRSTCQGAAGAGMSAKPQPEPGRALTPRGP